MSVSIMPFTQKDLNLVKSVPTHNVIPTYEPIRLNLLIIRTEMVGQSYLPTSIYNLLDTTHPDLMTLSTECVAGEDFCDAYIDVNSTSNTEAEINYTVQLILDYVPVTSYTDWVNGNYQ